VNVRLKETGERDERVAIVTQTLLTIHDKHKRKNSKPAAEKHTLIDTFRRTSSNCVCLYALCLK
jgi:hypothetical protein